MPFVGAGVGQMNRRYGKKRRKEKEYVPGEYGSYRYAVQTGVKDPRDFYNMKLEQLKQKRDAKRICSVCGEKATWEDKKLFKKNIMYCDKCMREKDVK